MSLNWVYKWNKFYIWLFGEKHLQYVIFEFLKKQFYDKITDNKEYEVIIITGFIFIYSI